MSEIVLKILLIGNSFVGKKSLLLKFTEGNFPDSNMATIGVEFKEKIIKIKDKDVKLQIWDTSGQERFRSITKNFFRNADGIIFIFDVTKYQTFQNIKDWIIDSEIAGNDFKKILVGNKIDLENERKIDKEKIESYANKKNIKYFEISAKEGKNVDEIFNVMAELILSNKTDKEIEEQFSQKIRSLSVSNDTKFLKRKKKVCL